MKQKHGKNFPLKIVVFSVVWNTRNKISEDAFDNQSEEFYGSEVQQGWGWWDMVFVGWGVKWKENCRLIPSFLPWLIALKGVALAEAGSGVIIIATLI